MTKLADMQALIKIEAQNSSAVSADTERAINKAVSLMSRLMPKRVVADAYLTRSYSAQALTIASSHGHLAYAPVRHGSVTIVGEIENTDYSVNYLDGTITEIGSGLADGAYVVSYQLDPSMIYIPDIVSSYVKIERIEYPIGTPVPFELWGNYALLRGITVTDKSNIRVVYLAAWTPPASSTDADYPTHLDDIVAIGATGEYLIFMAEKYTLAAATAVAAITAPTDYTISKPTSPTLATAPTAASAPTLSWTVTEAALDKVSDLESGEAGVLVTAKGYLTTGAALINAATRGENVGATYGAYATAAAGIASQYLTEAQAEIREQEMAVNLYSTQITSYGSAVNAYANTVSAQIGKYNGDINNEQIGVTNYQAQVSKYNGQIQDRADKVKGNLDVAGRYLASGQAKINEFLVALGIKPEFNYARISSEQRA